MKIIINPAFHHLEHFIRHLPIGFEGEGLSIYKARNEIKVFEVDGLALNVKSYRKPIFLNRVIYTFFRKSKARRAYENALEVSERGFNTPTPIAFIEENSGGLLERSYFISMQCPYSRMLREFEDNTDITGREDILQALGAYVAALHKAGILHLDLSIGNILFEKDGAGIHFCLIDINRMKFQTIGQKVGCKNFERLRGSEAFFKVLADSYAKACGYDAEDCFREMLHYYRKSIERFRRKRAFKQWIRKKR
jgi:Mn2+-dependent serine/threonine protein kinase